MPIYATKEAKSFWEKCPGKARSLASSKFVTIAESKNDKEWRKKSCEAIKAGKAQTEKVSAFSDFISTMVETKSAAIVFAKLEARLIIDSAGGVLENGGICLDRTSGIPFIPGSTVKGAARRYAIYQVGETEDLDEKAKLLVQICRIFGYGDQEWNGGREEKHNHSHSDFWLAMVPLCDGGQEHDHTRDERWDTVSEKAAKILAKDLSRTLDDEKPLPLQLPNLAGSVCFLPAYPNKDPGIETDVLTCHHGDYYAAGTGSRDIATDDEDPNPVFFPTVAAGGTFQFPLVLNGNLGRGKEDLDQAGKWLASGLELFGVGAKTNAGYGWFSIDHKALEKAKNERDLKIAEEIEVQKRKAMSPEDLIKFDLEKLDHDSFAVKVKDLSEQPEDIQKGICALLASSKLDQWKVWNKPKAKKWVSRIPAIREIAETHGIKLP